MRGMLFIYFVFDFLIQLWVGGLGHLFIRDAKKKDPRGSMAVSRGIERVGVRG